MFPPININPGLQHLSYSGSWATSLSQNYMEDYFQLFGRIAHAGAAAWATHWGTQNNQLVSPTHYTRTSGGWTKETEPFALYKQQKKVPRSICNLKGQVFRNDAGVQNIRLGSILTSLWPDIVFSNLPSYAPQIFISLSAAKIKKEKA